MANIYQKAKGTQDFFDTDARKMDEVCSVAANVASTYGCKYLKTPIFEYAEVFEKNVGEESDIVSKEMYTFKDKGDRLMTLRPEGTAAIARFFIENKMYANPGLTKFYYYGPMFRYERQQAGRYREFNQFGIEVYGQSSYLLDVDVIKCAYDIVRSFNIENVVLKINSIGDFNSRANYSKALKEYFSKYIDTMCEDCKRRLNTNPMRILDCKVDSENIAIKNAPNIKDYLTEESITYFNNVLKSLDKLNIPYVVDDNLVRGLDYYTDTVFEFIIKSNDDLNGLALVAGGKYANMISSMCGVDVPGIGFALGVERLKAIADQVGYKWACVNDEKPVVIMALDEESKMESMELASYLRKNNIKVELDYNSISMKSQFKLADRVSAKYIIIIGEAERINKVYSVKNTISRTQENVSREDLINYLNK